MNKFLLKFIIIYFFLSSFLSAQIINEVKIDGNKRISNETILVLGDIKLNSEYNDNDLNKSLKKLKTLKLLLNE